ncbi:MAG: Pup ligase PafA' paralog, possible component of postulated heterodimer PafA-PafA' [uncultured Propionibacteriaceae bacterium]|uniref:Pup ligase PafA' paralog, possible component of postulated heterodimer PafA-PafA n=1 Tax=uncultured Propionibacteriaceae bacterium TaxID=257457 RepID=A0A6J4NUR7_9ACTN|nr:MAG: Pup ligase PafA' paralog, possible component of postulated heterodimer PafA-PafA' [uncultured Propionibacteriaceae bacterium]
MGIETEYGISALGAPDDIDLHPMQLSNHVVKAYGSSAPGRPAGWDYETESPLRDLRGYEVTRGQAHPDQLTDTELGMANLILTNGARLYVDHAHPEYSGPEVTSAIDVVRFDKAGDLVMAIAAQRASQSLGRSVRLYKNNTDGKGASYGTHENYLLSRATPFDRVVTQFTGFLVSRQVISGAGRVGIGQTSQQHGFQLSQRADFFEAEVGLETTLNRPIINTRDEPHADASKHRRLHVITGDANLSEISTYLKVGSASWVLRMIEAGALQADVRVAAPVATMRAISHDVTAQARVTLTGGQTMTAVDLQEVYLHSARAYFETIAAELSEPAQIEAKDVFTRWQDCLDALRRDPFELADQLDWVAKLKLMQSYRDRDSLGWDSPKLALIDLQYADVDSRRSLYAALVGKGKMQTLLSGDEIERARTTPPEDTRAYFRGRVMEKFGGSVVAASWDSVIFDVPDRPALQRIPLLDPLRGTREQVGQMIDSCSDVTELFAALGR